MNKKVMALAVASALTAPGLALAQVQIGGSLTVLWYSHDPDNNSVGQSGDILESSEPELYIRSEEKLGGGNSVWFQCASSLDGFISGAGAAAGFCARNSAVGFRGGFGNIFVGNWDTPTKLVQNRIRGWFSGTNPLVGGGFTLLAGGSGSGTVNPTGSTPGTNGANATSFYRRQAQSVNYWSPNFGGFSVAAAFSANNESTGIPDSSSLTPRLMGINGVYAAGPLWVGAAYEKHDDYNPGGVANGTTASLYNGNSDDNITIGAGYTFAGLNARIAYSKSTYETSNSGDLEAKGYAFYADWNIQGPHTIRFAFITVDDTSGNTSSSVGSYKGPLSSGCGATSTVSCSSQTGADVTTLAYSYSMSKRTELFFAYNQMKNDSNATFSLGKTAASAGGKQKAIGMGLKHSF